MDWLVTDNKDDNLYKNRWNKRFTTTAISLCSKVTFLTRSITCLGGSRNRISLKFPQTKEWELYSAVKEAFLLTQVSVNQDSDKRGSTVTERVI
jgi:hypothetical protein